MKIKTWSKSENKEKNRGSSKFWKLLSYPLCVIIVVVVFGTIIGSVVPTINQYGYFTFLYPNLNDSASYTYYQTVFFPVFYCVDGVLVYLAFKISKFLTCNLVRIMNKKGDCE